MLALQFLAGVSVAGVVISLFSVDFGPELLLAIVSCLS
jgi:hypothetical protein